jgi:hypothetical protein
MFSRILIKFFVFIFTLNSYGMDDRYTRALHFRDGTITGYTKAQSLDEAEKLFKALGLEGNPKAMHNYAMIQYNKKNYDLAYEWFQKAANLGLHVSEKNARKMIDDHKIKKTLHLVVGTTRQTDVSFGPLINAIYQHDSTDLSHQNTFAGKATSMDLLKSDVEGADHIVGDARSFDFSKYQIASVFIEKISTIDDKNLMILDDKLKRNYVGDCIINISRSMKSGATIEMEWLPYCALYGLDQHELDNFITHNPFHSFLNINVMLQGICILGGDHENLQIIPAELHVPILKMAERIKSILEFYHQKGAGKSYEELLRLAYLEAAVWINLERCKCQMFLNYSFYDQNALDLEKALQNVKFGKFTNISNNWLGQKIDLRDGSTNAITGYIYDLPTFLSQCFLNFMVSDIAAAYNSPQVINYLESIGFDASIEKKNNPHNGRNNVWMITMKKR